MFKLVGNPGSRFARDEAKIIAGVLVIPLIDRINQQADIYHPT